MRLSNQSTHYRFLDLSDHKGRVFVVGDIHGAFSKLEKALENVGFNREQDILLSVGDLVDRGPENERVLEFLNYPWFYAVQGNHEQITYAAGGTYHHLRNGGGWYNEYKGDKSALKNRFFNLPVVMEVALPNGETIGLVHAGIRTDDWNDLRDPDYIAARMESLLWDRGPLEMAQFGYTSLKVIKNIDHVFYGHTPLEKPFHFGNQSWIDTGAVWDDGYFTLIEVGHA